VREFPTRIKCASLAWHTMKAAVAHHSGALALSEVEGPVTTE
jgi:NifU-like protein involved in Fe-S cluster formation